MLTSIATYRDIVCRYRVTQISYDDSLNCARDVLYAVDLSGSLNSRRMH